MKKVLIALALCVSTNDFILAQANDTNESTSPLNSIGINFLGDASLISMHYDRLFILNQNFVLSAKLGFGYNEEFKLCVFGNCPPPRRFMIAPHHFTINFGNGKHFLELGGGGSVLFGNPAQPYVLYPIMGYRIVPTHLKKIGFRIYAQFPANIDLDSFQGAFFLIPDDIPFIPLGLNLSYCF